MDLAAADKGSKRLGNVKRRREEGGGEGGEGERREERGGKDTGKGHRQKRRKRIFSLNGNSSFRDKIS